MADLHSPLAGHDLSIFLCFVLGALHALEPGHGKTAIAAHLVAQKSLFRPALAALSTAFSHSVSILLIATLVHGILDVTLQESSNAQLYKWLNLGSGTLLVAVGVWLVISQRVGKAAAHGQGCGCPSHGADPTKGVLNLQGIKKHDSLNTMLLGFAVGLLPCPTALVALSQAILARDWMMIASVTLTFAAGIFVGLFAVGSFLGLKVAPYVLSVPAFKKSSRNFAYLQALVVSATGIWHVFLGL
ncbi:MAG: sulfite exporter TauE/SafE family protein [Bacteriovoracia bacterium]